MATIRELITGSLRLINVVQANEVPTAEDMQISLYALNAMIDSWSTENLNIYFLGPQYFPLTAGQKIYSLGPGGDWDTSRPMNIENITVSYGGSLVEVDGKFQLVKNPNIIDIPMEKLQVSQYAAISVKDQPSTYPLKFYDDGDFPLRNVYVWPVPTVNMPVTLWLRDPLTDPNTLDTEFNFPPGYFRAMRYALAIELSAEFGKEVQPEVVVVATNAKATIKRLNSNSKVGILRSDIGILGGQPGIYNYNLSTTAPN